MDVIVSVYSGAWSGLMNLAISAICWLGSGMHTSAVLRRAEASDGQRFPCSSASLTEQFGIVLFERGGKTVAPMDACKRLPIQAFVTVAEANATVAVARDLRRYCRGFLVQHSPTRAPCLPSLVFTPLCDAPPALGTGP